MKLVALLVLSATCAFAAPQNFFENDALVPETTDSRGDEVALLKQQFLELKSQLNSGMEVTPGVKRTIDKMVTMVEGRIEPAIREAHATDQSDLNTLMGAVQTRNNVWVEEEKVLQADANNVRRLIDDEHAKSNAWEAQAGVFTKTQNNYLDSFDKQTTTCCDRDNAAVLDVEYVPAYASCDYKQQGTSGDCAKVARDNVASVVTSPFSAGLTTYRGLRSSCTKLTTELQSGDADTQTEWITCTQDKKTEKSAAKLAAEQQARVQKSWDTATSTYHKNYASLMSDFNTRQGVVKSDDKDRHEEWQGTQTIKCMLLAYSDGGKMDEAQEKKCGASIQTTGVVDMAYPAVVPEQQPTLEPFEAQIDDSAYEKTCDARTPAPSFSCTAREARAVPQCTHSQPEPPVHQHHEGPWNGEVEAKSWGLDAGAGSP